MHCPENIADTEILHSVPHGEILVTFAAKVYTCLLHEF